jgi:hypothetical protein
MSKKYLYIGFMLVTFLTSVLLTVGIVVYYCLTNSFPFRSVTWGVALTIIVCTWTGFRAYTLDCLDFCIDEEFPSIQNACNSTVLKESFVAGLWLGLFDFFAVLALIIVCILLVWGFDVNGGSGFTVIALALFVFFGSVVCDVLLLKYFLFERVKNADDLN